MIPVFGAHRFNQYSRHPNSSASGDLGSMMDDRTTSRPSWLGWVPTSQRGYLAIKSR
jgi:hypothetical protein